jgi:hypothetical protein
MFLIRATALPRWTLRRFSVAKHVLLTLTIIVAARLPAIGQSIDFESDVAPILIRRCLECHQSSNPSGNLDLTTSTSVLKGGDSGPVIVAGKEDASFLVQRILASEMPPPVRGVTQTLPAEEVQILKDWISSGAEFPTERKLDLYERTTDVRGGRDWWSFQPLPDVVPPQLADRPDKHPIDAFIGTALAERGLEPAPAASPDVLIRRLYWDLIGLPPSADEITQWTDRLTKQPQSIDLLIDELLDSPHFGERWARHWLDVVRFAETCGYERDQVLPNAWKYRDWVVDAFNSDMPYDRFVREQLAGDQLPDRNTQSVIATGFLRLGTWNDEPNDPDDYQYERLEDLVHVTSSAFLGLTTKCARCHDHKFDPIPQADYYRMAAAFWPGPISARGRELLGGPTADELGFSDVLGWTDITTSPQPLHVLKNGERSHPLEAVEAGPLTCAMLSTSDALSAPAASDSTGLRLQLANWIADRQNPLTARVIVNRLWQHHFGFGLVRSANNFGFTGDQPTHPELLDWLASELIRGGWKLKPIHRLIVSSATWQQASIHPRDAEFTEIDAANASLWKAHRRRKDAESMRDAFLHSTNELDPKRGGPSFYPSVSDEALEGLSRKGAAWTASPETEQMRRSLYMFMQRSLLPPLMTTFDLCDSTMPCDQRDITIVAPQALTLLNNEFVHQRAAVVARTALSGSADPDQQLRILWRSILKREPRSEELAAGLTHLKKQRHHFQPVADAAATSPTPEILPLASLALVLFNTNEFLYVD